MENFKQGLNQFWVGAVFGICLALSLVLIPVAIVTSSINDVLKIHEVSQLMTQVSTLVGNTKSKIINTKERLSAISLENLDNEVLQLVITTAKDYQLQVAELSSEQAKIELKTHLQQRLQTTLSDRLTSEQLNRVTRLFELFTNDSKS